MRVPLPNMGIFQAILCIVSLELTFVAATYLTIILMVSALSVIFTIFVLDVYFKTEDGTEVPEWLQKFTRGFFVRVTCWHANVSSGTKISPVSEDRTRFNMAPDDSWNDKKINNKYDDGNIDTKIHAIEAHSDKEQRLKAERAGLGNKCYTWKEIALVMDRCFMIGFILMVLIASIVCLSLLVSAHKHS